MEFPHFLLSLVFPNRCLQCRSVMGEGAGICYPCWNQLTFISAPVCPHCGIPHPSPDQEGLLCGRCVTLPPFYDKARSAVVYDAHSRGLPLSLKNGDKTLIAAHVAPWLARAGSELLPSVDALVPVPLHWRRQFIRQFNQSTLLANQLSQLMHIPLVHALKRKKHTPSQGHLNPRERHKNVHSAFTVSRPQEIKEKTVMLIDDVLTTGATVDACAAALKKSGAKAVFVLTLCRVANP